MLEDGREYTQALEDGVEETYDEKCVIAHNKRNQINQTGTAYQIKTGQKYKLLMNSKLSHMEPKDRVRT